MDEIREYAKKRAGLTEEEFQVSLRHARLCCCLPCRKFETYIRIVETVSEWENRASK